MLGSVVNGSVWGYEGLACGAVSAEYDVATCSEMPIWVMCACHVGSTRVEESVGPLGSLRCGVCVGSSRVARKVYMHVRSCKSESCSPLRGSLASIASVFRI